MTIRLPLFKNSCVGRNEGARYGDFVAGSVNLEVGAEIAKLPVLAITSIDRGTFLVRMIGISKSLRARKQ